MYVNFVKREEFSKPYQQIDRRTFTMKQYIRGVIQAWNRKQETNKAQEETGEQEAKDAECAGQDVTGSDAMDCSGSGHSEGNQINTPIYNSSCVVKFEPVGYLVLPETTV